MTSPKPEPDNDDASSDERDTLAVIGVGSFGIIHAGSPSIIYKRTIHSHDDANALWSLADEYDHHVAIDAAFNTWNSSHMAAPLHVRIPHPLRFLDPANLYAQAWWSTHLGSFGASGAIAPPTAPQPLLQASRIPAVPKEIRRRLIDLYCPESTQKGARASIANEDCLLRLYLGKEPSNESIRPSRFFSLRNFQLDIERMRRLGIDRAWVAREMGRTLAIVHWLARFDGRDVELVLGGADVPVDEFSDEVVRWSELPQITASMSTVSSTPSSKPATRRTSVAFGTPILPVVPSTLKLAAALSTGASSGRRASLIKPPTDAAEAKDKDLRDPGEDGVVALFGEHRVAIYLLDFNQCRKIEPDEDGVKKCVEAFFLNDAYFPKPPLPVHAGCAVYGTQEQQAEKKRLWEEFESAYLATTVEIVSEFAEDERGAITDCSELFIAGLKERWAVIAAEREQARLRDIERQMPELEEMPESSNSAAVEPAQAPSSATRSSVVRDPSMYFGSPKRAIDPAWGFY